MNITHAINSGVRPSRIKFDIAIAFAAKNEKNTKTCILEKFSTFPRANKPHKISTNNAIIDTNDATKTSPESFSNGKLKKYHPG